MSYRDDLLGLLTTAGLGTWEFVAQLDFKELRRRLAEAAAELSSEVEIADEVIHALQKTARLSQGIIVAYQLPGRPTKSMPGRPSEDPGEAHNEVTQKGD